LQACDAIFYLPIDANCFAHAAKPRPKFPEHFDGRLNASILLGELKEITASDGVPHQICIGASSMRMRRAD
jgi:hypothetical protein